MRPPLAQTGAIFRAVRDAGDGGLFLEQIAAQVGADADSHALYQRLKAMVQRKYLCRLGKASSHRWVMGVRMPEGESDVVGAGHIDGWNARPFAALQSPSFVAELRGVPCSVWDMARRIALHAGQP